jgi:hypothetical protein
LQGYIQKENGIKKNPEITSYHHHHNNNNKGFNQNGLTNQLVHAIHKYNSNELPFCPCLLGPSNESSSELALKNILHITSVMLQQLNWMIQVAEHNCLKKLSFDGMEWSSITQDSWRSLDTMATYHPFLSFNILHENLTHLEQCSRKTKSKWYQNRQSFAIAGFANQVNRILTLHNSYPSKPLWASYPSRCSWPWHDHINHMKISCVPLNPAPKKTHNEIANYHCGNILSGCLDLLIINQFLENMIYHQF